MNLTNCSAAFCPEQTRAFTKKTVVALTLSAIMLLTAVLNSAVIAAICVTKKLHQPANYLICSLALTDLLVAVSVMPVSILYISMETWVLGHVVCEAWLSLDMTFCTCSILHLCVIALDRYWAITDAVRYAGRRTAKRAVAMIVTVWVISVCIAIPPLFWRSHDATRTGPQCIINHDHAIYTIYSTFGAFYVPLALILVLYYRIYHAAKTLYQKRGSSHRSAGRGSPSYTGCKLAHTFCVSDPGLESTRSQLAVEAAGRENGELPQISSGRERRAARVLGLILGAFVVCWLPFFVKELLTGIKLWAVSPKASDFLTWLGYVNSLINPLLYTSFNEDFKLAFRRFTSCRKHR
ncbi:5-hydroxytryptamine receptor 1E [Hypanus sabinus]|uniref:5-hydroxytryptamine receptor 1E n=1 Tax=Hypanus sabinus TaxID=79690 RepID=UPI0028C41694|nr:5-hydroxytryptamine receptor 1E [Hypanus sabinus]